MKKKSSIILHSLFFVICLVLAVLFLYHIISIRRLNVKYTPAITEESSRELDNLVQKKLRFQSISSDASGD